MDNLPGAGSEFSCGSRRLPRAPSPPASSTRHSEHSRSRSTGRPSRSPRRHGRPAGARMVGVGPVPERSRGHTWCLPSGPWRRAPLGPTRLGPFNGKSGKMRRQGLCAGPTHPRRGGTDRATTHSRLRAASAGAAAAAARRRGGAPPPLPPTCRPPTCAPNPNQAAPGTPGVAAHNAALPAQRHERVSSARARLTLARSTPRPCGVEPSVELRTQQGAGNEQDGLQARRWQESSSSSGGREPTSLEP